MNTSLLLIRHGDVVYVDREGVERPELIYNGDTAQLTDLGRSQLESLGRTLKREGVIPETIISSDFRRAVDSASALSRGIGRDIAIIENPFLRDVVAPGWDGLLKEEFVRHTNGDIYSFIPQTREQEAWVKGQESLAQIADRQRRVERLLYVYRAVEFHDSKIGGGIAFVGHGDQMSALHWVMSHEKDQLPNNYWEMKESFYLEKAEAHLLTLDPNLRIVGEGRRIRIPEVDQSIEGWRNQGKEK